MRLSGGLFLLGALAAAAFAQVPTPESVLGHKPGDDFYLATYEDALGYFKKVASSSNRIKLVNVGKTTRGREWWIAFIPDPANLAQLDHYKDVSRRLALSRGITDEQAHDRVPAPRGKGYLINVASFKNGVGYGKWTHIDGWSEAVIEYIRALEQTASSN